MTKEEIKEKVSTVFKEILPLKNKAMRYAPIIAVCIDTILTLIFIIAISVNISYLSNIKKKLDRYDKTLNIATDKIREQVINEIQHSVLRVKGSNSSIPKTNTKTTNKETMSVTTSSPTPTQDKAVISNEQPIDTTPVTPTIKPLTIEEEKALEEEAIVDHSDYVKEEKNE